MASEVERRALLLCSSDIHAEMFAPLEAELRRRGWITSAVALDKYYSQRARDVARGVGLECEELGRPGGQLETPFYGRPFVRVWADVLQARDPVERLLDRFRPHVVIVGNDYGLIEKLVLHTARRRGVSTALVQDGVLGRTSRPPMDGWQSRALRLARRLASPLLRGLGLPYLAASNYGTFPVDLICASGSFGLEYFLGLGVPLRRIVVTGQPRYDELRDRRRSPVDGRLGDRIAFFTTPFAMQNLGDEPQARQAALIVALADLFREHGLRLIVKRHPRETALADPAAVDLSQQRAADLLQEVAVAVIGISTVLEEAALLGVPVLVPGEVVHGRRFEDFLPPPDAYPRFESAAEAVALIEEFRNPARRKSLVARQSRHIERALAVDHVRSAASRVADAVELLHAA